MEVTGRWEKNQHSDKQGFGRFAYDAYNETRRVQAKSPQEEIWEVLKHREAVKSRQESRFEANTQTSPIGKGSIYLSALTGTAVGKVTVRDHLVRVCERPSSACVRVTRNTASGKSPAELRN